jgi:CRP-like cAMP-binding protein
MIVNSDVPVRTQWRSGQFVRNAILRGLPLRDFEHIRPFLQPVTLKERSVLQEPNRRVEYVHFVETGLVSLMTLASGRLLETAMVGSQGAVSASIALGSNTSSHRSIVLVSGNALRIPADELQRSMHERPQIREHFLRYIHSLMIHCFQTSLCGVQHHLEERLACWLCLACDALDDDVLPITHDHLSDILGFRRPTVTVSLKKLEEMGLIRKLRGVLQICNRMLLERKACCCYGILSNTYKPIKVAELSSPALSMNPTESSMSDFGQLSFLLICTDSSEQIIPWTKMTRGQ